MWIYTRMLHEGIADALHLNSGVILIRNTYDLINSAIFDVMCAPTNNRLQ